MLPMASPTLELLPVNPIYQKLPSSKSVRLLSIDAAEPGGILSCTLHVVELTSVPPYTALSYVWGKPEPRTPIFCNGLQTTVTSNLGAALHKLRVKVVGSERLR